MPGTSAVQGLECQIDHILQSGARVPPVPSTEPAVQWGLRIQGQILCSEAEEGILGNIAVWAKGAWPPFRCPLKGV